MEERRSGRGRRTLAFVGGQTRHDNSKYIILSQHHKNCKSHIPCFVGHHVEVINASCIHSGCHLLNNCHVSPWTHSAMKVSVVQKQQSAVCSAWQDDRKPCLWRNSGIFNFPYHNNNYEKWNRISQLYLSLHTRHIISGVWFLKLVPKIFGITDTMIISVNNMCGGLTY